MVNNDDKDLVDGVLQLLVRPQFHNHYRKDLLESVGRTTDNMKKQELVKIFFDEIGLLFPKTLLRYKPGEDPKANKRTPMVGYKRPCTKCPKQKHKIGDEVVVRL